MNIRELHREPYCVPDNGAASEDRVAPARRLGERMELDLLASAYGLLECPLVDERDRLYFSDMVLGGIHRRSLDGTIETVIPARKHIGGMAFNEGGGLVFCGEGGVAAWD